MDTKLAIEIRMAVDSNSLTAIAIDRIEGVLFDDACGHIFPTFCFDNSIEMAVLLNAGSVVFGIAVSDIGDFPLMTEHAWIKSSEGQHYDPTYQALGDNTDQDVIADTSYYSLIELSIAEYRALSDEVHGGSEESCDDDDESGAKIKTLNFTNLRNSGLFDEKLKRVRRL